MGGFSNSLGSVFVDIDGDLSKLQATLRKALPEAQKAGEEIGKAIAQGTRVTSVSDYFTNLGGALQNFRNVAGQALRDLQQFTPILDRFGAAASSLGTKLSVGVTLPLVGLATASIKAAADMDALERGLVAVTGSSAEAERQLKELREVAKLPGLGLREAVQGATNLQALGFSAKQTQSILLSFGNALASVGRGKADLDEVIRQLGQLGARGVVTADNLRPIIERVPQVAAIIKREFGPEALSEPAKRFEQLGISSQKFIEVLVRELDKLPKVTGGLKNDLENFQDALFESFSKIGKELTPFVSQFTNSVVPALQTAVQVFSALPEPVKQSAIVIGLLSAAFGPLLGAFGQAASGLSALIKLLGVYAAESRAAAVATAALNAATGSSGVAGSVGLLSRILTPANILLASFGAAALVTAANLNTLEAAAGRAFDEGFGKLTDAESKQFTERLKSMGLTVEQFKNLSLEDLEKVQQKFQQFDNFKAPVTGFTVTVEGASKAVDKLAVSHDKAAAATERHANKAVFGATTFERFTVAASKLGNAFRDIPVKIPLIEDLPPDIDIVKDRMEELREETRLAHAVLNDLNNTDLSALGDEFDQAADRFRAFFDDIKDGKEVLHDLTVGSERQVKAIGDIFDEAAKRQGISTRKQGEAVTQLGRQVSTVLTDMSRDITKVIFEGGKLGDVFQKTGFAIRDAIVRNAIEGGTKLLLKQLDTLLEKIPGLGTAISKIPGFGSIATPPFAGGTIPGTGGGTSGIPSVGGTGGAASGALGTVSQITGIITGALTAASSIIGNFQQAHANTALGRIEESTRFIKIGFLEGEQAVQPNVFRLWQLSNEATKAFWGFTVPTMTRMLTELETINANTRGGIKGGTGNPGTVIINLTSNDPRQVLDQISDALRPLGYRFQAG